ncbi:MAG: SGNH/GDSL hydrolase family protein [Clostridium sp.]|nr:SGNH/GDSL hydrolase family protein [Clostridium sp.]
MINTPYNSPIFSDVAATENGTVIFVISAAMIDEVREVGIYDIQIRLLDDNKQSRVTIPPVSNAIEIREPMAIEDGSPIDSNVVNVAKVNRALTTTSAPLEAFDSQGNYIKKTWGDGDPITDAALNKMEAGIDGVNKKIANANNINDTAASATTTYSSNKIETIKEGLSSRINTIENDGVSQTVIENKVQSVINEKIADGTLSQVEAVIENGSITKNMLNNEVFEDTHKIDVYGYSSKGLWDVCLSTYLTLPISNYIVKDSILPIRGTLTSETHSNITGICVTGCKVISGGSPSPTVNSSVTSNYENDIYTFTSSVRFYSEELVEFGVIIGVKISDITMKTQYSITSLEMQIDGNWINILESSTKYNVYKPENIYECKKVPLGNAILKSSLLNSSFINNSMLQKNIIGINNLEMDTRRNDCYMSVGKTFDRYGEGHHITIYNIPNDLKLVEGDIPVLRFKISKNNNVISTNFQIGTFSKVPYMVEANKYYEDDNFMYYSMTSRALQSIAADDTLIININIITETALDDITLYTSNVELEKDGNIQRVYSNNCKINGNPNPVQSQRVYYKYYNQLGLVDYNILDSIINSLNPIYGKKLGCLGDSITQKIESNSSMNYWDYLAQWNNLQLNINGISGTAISDNGAVGDTPGDSRAMCYRYTELEDDCDIIIVFAGTNDMSANFGEYGDNTPNTLHGALRIMLSGLRDKFYDKKIYYVTPMKLRNEGIGFEKNLQMIDVIKQECADYGIPVLDLYRNANFNPFNEKQRIAYIPDKTHPNIEGHKKIAELIDKFIKTF